jgi:TPR repeat protein
LYKKAADQGLTEAQLKLGLAYQSGEGAPINEAEAVKWFQKAAAQGHDGAKRLYQEITQQ